MKTRKTLAHSQDTQLTETPQMLELADCASKEIALASSQGVAEMCSS
jgi:hypothetical protein